MHGSEKAVAVVAHPSPFRAETVRFALPFGSTLKDIVDLAVPKKSMQVHARVWLDGELIENAWWERVRPREHHCVAIACVPAQSNLPKEANVRTILQIMTNVGGMLVGGLVIGGPWGMAASALISVAGYFLWNALIPLPEVPRDALSRPNLAGANNPIEEYAVFPYVAGRGWPVLRQVARPYTTLEGDQQYLHMLLACCKGDARVSDIKIGQTPIENFTGLQWEVFNSSKVAESCFKNNVQELAVLELAKGYESIRLNGGAAALVLGTPIDSSFGVVRVTDLITGASVTSYLPNYALGTLAYTGAGGVWPAGSDRFEVVFWNANRAVVRTTPAAAEAISLELDFLEGLYKTEEGQSQPSQTGARCEVAYRMRGTSDAWVNYLTFGPRQDQADVFGGANTIQLPVAPIGSVQRIRDLTGDVFGTLPRDISPADYVVDAETGEITRTDGQPWGEPPWWYRPQQHVVLPIKRDIQLLAYPVEPETTVQISVWNGAIWYDLDPADYTVNYETGVVHWDGALGFWPIGIWDLQHWPPYRATYSAAVKNSQASARWRVIYKWDPLAVATATFTEDILRGHLVTATGKINDIVAAVKAVAAGLRTSTVAFRSDMLAILSRVMGRLPLMDPTGADPVLQPIIDALQDWNGNSGGLGELRLLMDAYTDVLNPEDSSIVAQNDAAALVLQAIDPLVNMFIYIANEEDGASRAPLYPDVQRFCAIQTRLAPLFGAALYDGIDLSYKDTNRAILRRTVQWSVLPSTYDVSVKRMPHKNSSGQWVSNWPPVDDTETDYVTAMTVGYLRALGTGRAILEPDVTCLAIRANASDRLTGYIDNVTASVEPRIPVWHDDTKTWVQEITYNPAWHYLYLLLGGLNARPVQSGYPVWAGAAWLRDRIDMPAFIEWASICDEKSWRIGHEFDSDTTVWAAMKLVAACGRAAPDMRDGQYSVVLDKDLSDLIPAHTFSPRNVRSLEVSIAFVKRPHAIKAQFRNEALRGKEDEVVVYDDGYNADGAPELEIDELDGGEAVLAVIHGPIATEQQAVRPGEWGVDSVVDVQTGDVVDAATYVVDYAAGTVTKVGGTWGAGAARWRVVFWGARTAATEFEQIPLPGCPGTAQAWRHTRWVMACAKLRPRKFVFTTDWAGIRCTRGDKIAVQHYVALIGLHAGARASAITTNAEGHVTHITVDDYWTMEAGKQYGIRVEYRDGYSALLGVVTAPGDANDVIALEAPAPESPGGTKIQVGDHICFGLVDQVTRDLVVTETRNSRHLEARITAVDHAPAVHQAEERYIPEFDPGITTPPSDNLFEPDPPVIASVVSDESVMTRVGDRLISNILISLQAPGDNVGDTEAPAYVQLEWRRFSAANDGTWIRRSDVPIDARQVLLPDVIEAETYDLRLRYRTALSRTSAWTEVWEYYVVGKSTPPPDVTEFRIENGKSMRWAYPRQPIDHAGFEIRWLPYSDVVYPDNNWDAAPALHGGLITELEYDLPAALAGPVTLLLRAVDAGGHYSVNSAVIRTSIGDANAQNIIVTQDEHAGGFAGTIIDGAVDPATGDLVGGYHPDNLFWTDDAQPFWSGDDSQLFWQVEYTGVSYVFTVTPPPNSGGSSMTLALAGAVPAEAALAAFYLIDGAMDAYEVFPGRLTVEEGATYYFQIVLVPHNAGQTAYAIQPRITALSVNIDVPDIEERFEDLVITDPAAGLRLPLQKQYNAVVYVSLTLQDAPGATAVGMRVLDKARPPSEIGPLVKAYDDVGAPATALFDAVVRGY